MSGMEDVVIAGGCEMMSLHPALGAAQTGVRGPLMDAGNERLRARHPQTHQGVAADAIATLEGIPREALDELALVSPAARRPGDRRGPLRQQPRPGLPRGRHARPRPRGVPPPETTLEGLAKLTPSFAAMADVPLDDQGTTLRSMVLARYPDLEIEHVHHAGNSSGVVDGAAAILLASPDAASGQRLDAAGRASSPPSTWATTRR